MLFSSPSVGASLHACCLVGCRSLWLGTRAHICILLVRLLLLLVLRLVCACRPQATSNTLWAYAKLAYWPPQSLLTAAGAQMVADLTKSVPQVLKSAGMFSACCSKPCYGCMLHALQQAAALCTTKCFCNTIHRAHHS